MPWRRTAHHVFAIAAVTAASLILLIVSPAKAQHCWAGFAVGFEAHGSYSTRWPAAIGQSGYDPFVLDHQTGRFRYVPIPYDPEPPGSGYSPCRINWHSGRWDYVPAPIEQDYRLWRAMGTQTNNIVGVSGADTSGAAGLARAPVAAHSVTPSAPSRATATTIVDRVLPPAPLPPPPTRGIPRGSKSPTTRPTLAPPPPARGAPAPGPAPAPPQQQQPSSARGAKGDVDDGWTKVRGVTGRWEYDYQHARWIFVLPPD